MLPRRQPAKLGTKLRHPGGRIASYFLEAIGTIGVVFCGRSVIALRRVVALDRYCQNKPNMAARSIPSNVVNCVSRIEPLPPAEVVVEGTSITDL